MPIASSMPNSRVRSNTVIMKLLKMLNVTSTATSESITRLPARFSCIVARFPASAVATTTRRSPFPSGAIAASTAGNIASTCSKSRDPGDHHVYLVAEPELVLKSDQLNLHQYAIEFGRTGFDDAADAQRQRRDAAVEFAAEQNEFVADVDAEVARDHRPEQRVARTRDVTPL